MATTSERGRLLLYGTSACHLCELALQLVTAEVAQDWALQQVDIAASDALFERYALTIPVLRREDTGAELHWPFDRDALGEFLGRA